jgi:hypothetical protein
MIVTARNSGVTFANAVAGVKQAAATFPPEVAAMTIDIGMKMTRVIYQSPKVPHLAIKNAALEACLDKFKR